MAQTDLDICNRAITRAGGDPIDAISEDTPVGAFCVQNYASRRDYCLGKHRWVFLNQVAKLTETPADAAAPLPYAFVYPADVIGAIHAYREAANLDAAYVRTVQMNGKIYADRAEVWIEYTRRKGEHEWPANFAELVATAFAADVANFAQNRTLARELEERAWGRDGEGGLYLEARQEDARNAPQRELQRWDDTGPLIGVRQIAGPWPGTPGRGGFSFIDFD